MPIFSRSNLRRSADLTKDIQLYRFVNDRIFETKRGDIGIVLSVKGVDPDGRTEESLSTIAATFQQALRHLDDRFRLHQYVIKRSQPTIPHKTQYHSRRVTDTVMRRISDLSSRAEDLYEISLYWVVLFEGFRLPAKLGVRQHRLRQRGEESACRSIETLEHTVATFIESLSDSFAARALAQDDAFPFFRSLLNYDKQLAAAFRGSPNSRLDQSILASQVDVFKGHLAVNDYYVKAAGLRFLPSESHPAMMADLLAIPCDFILCSEWKAQDNLTMRRKIKSKKRNFDALMFDAVSTAIAMFLTSDKMPPQEPAKPAKEIVSHIDTLDDCLSEIGNKGNYFGAYSLTLIFLNEKETKAREAFYRAVKVLGSWEAEVIEERINLKNAWLSILPGNYTHNHRYHYLLNVKAAEMGLLWQSSTGDQTHSHLNDEYWCLYETASQELYYDRGHVGGVYGALAFGAPETGKSFGTNYRIAHAQKYNAVTLILDIGGSYRDLTAEFGGEYFEISLGRDSVSFNPFALPKTDDNAQFLFQFIRLLVGRDETAAPEQLAREDKQIFEAIEAIYFLQPSLRRLSNLHLPGLLDLRLNKWREGNQYGRFFDCAEGIGELGDFSTFEFQGMERYPDVLTPLCFLITQLFHQRVLDPRQSRRFKLQVLDECWRFMLTSQMGPYLVESVKTGRKHNLGNLFVTQSGKDMERAGLAEMLREACPTTYFYANPNIKPATYRELFGLNEKQIEIVQRLRAKREMAIHTATSFKKVALQVDNAHDRALYSNDPQSNWEKRQKTSGGITIDKENNDNADGAHAHVRSMAASGD